MVCECALISGCVGSLFFSAVMGVCENYSAVLSFCGQVCRRLCFAEVQSGHVFLGEWVGTVSVCGVWVW